MVIRERLYHQWDFGCRQHAYKNPARSGGDFRSETEVGHLAVARLHGRMQKLRDRSLSDRSDGTGEAELGVCFRCVLSSLLGKSGSSQVSFDAGNVENPRRQIVRDIRIARQLAANVAMGVFPGSCRTLICHLLTVDVLNLAINPKNLTIR